MIAPNDRSLNMEFKDFKSTESELKVKNDIKELPKDGPKESNDLSLTNIYLDSNEDLCPLLRLQGLFGITYCGSTPFGKKHSAYKKIGFLVYDSVFILFFLLIEFMAHNDDSLNRIFRQTAHKGIMNAVYKISGMAIVLEYIVIKSLLLVNGRELYCSIHAIG